MNRLILLAVLAVVILGLWTSYLYMVPPELPVYEKGVADERAKELGYIPGEILIQLKGEEIDLSTNIGMRRFLKFLGEQSAELTPIFVTELQNSGKLLESDISEEWLNELEDTLIVYADSFGSATGALLSIAIDDALWGIITELKKSDLVEDATPNYLLTFDSDDFSAAQPKKKIVPPDDEKRCPAIREYIEANDGMKDVNCFPGNPPVYCHPDYKAWIKENCLNFRFSS